MCLFLLVLFHLMILQYLGLMPFSWKLTNISKRDVEKVMNTMIFHRKNTVARVKYQGRNYVSDDLYNEKINLQERNKLTDEEYEHITSHGYITGENPTVEEILYYNGKNTLFVCLKCERVFPSYMSLVLNSLYFKEHTNMYSEIYCPLCGKFEEKTTFSAHLLKKHSYQVKCLMCPAVFQHVSDLITHIVQPNPHSEIPTEIRLLLTENQVSALHKFRKENPLMHQSTDITVIPIIPEKGMI